MSFEARPSLLEVRRFSHPLHPPTSLCSSASSAALDLSAQRTRAIASRVSQASVNSANGFTLPIDPATGKPAETNQVDLEQEMTSLADEQVRFDATEKLLEKTYAQLRTAIKDK
jgi:flagellar basal body rod protein FlgB